MTYLLYIALIFAVTVCPGLVPRAMALEGIVGHQGQPVTSSPPVRVAPAGGKVGRGPALRRDGTFAPSGRRVRRIGSIQQRYLGNPKKKDWAERKLFRQLTESGGAHLGPDGSRQLSLLRRLYGLPLLGTGIAGGGFGLAGLAHVGTIYGFVTGKMTLSALGATLFTTAGLAGAAMAAVLGATVVGGTVALAGLALRHRAKKVELPHRDLVAAHVARLLQGESPNQPTEGPNYASGVGNRAAEEAAMAQYLQALQQQAHRGGSVDSPEAPAGGSPHRQGTPEQQINAAQLAELEQYLRSLGEEPAGVEETGSVPPPIGAHAARPPVTETVQQ